MPSSSHGSNGRGTGATVESRYFASPSCTNPNSAMHSSEPPHGSNHSTRHPPSSINLTPRDISSSSSSSSSTSPYLPNFDMITSPTSTLSSSATPSPLSLTSLPPFGIPGPGDSDSLNNNATISTTTAGNTTTGNLPSQRTSNLSHNTTSQPMTLPEILEGITKAESFPTVRHRWNTNEEIAALLIAIERHDSWLIQEVKIRYADICFFSPSLLILLFY